MSQMQEEAKATLEHAVDEMAWYYNCQRSPAPAYKVRDKVWLNAQNYMTTHPTKKLDHKWLGPFVIEKVLSVTLGSPGYGQGPLGPADIRSAMRLPPQPPGPPGVPLEIWGQ